MKTTDWASQAAREFSATVIGLSDASETKLAEIIRNHAHFARPTPAAYEDGKELMACPDCGGKRGFNAGLSGCDWYPCQACGGTGRIVREIS